MTGRLRILDTGLRPARWNTAASAALLAHADETGQDVLRFHRYPAACVIGRNQDAAVELDLAGCRAANVEIARRVTGGGAVVMGPGVLAWDLVLATPRRDVQALARRAGEALVTALAALGPPACLATPGSVEIAGRKVSGSAGRLGRRAALHQATLIVDLEATAPLALLRRRTEGGRPTADPTHRVVDLKGALLAQGRPGPEPTLPALQARLAAALSDAFGLVPQADELTPVEGADADLILAREAGSDDYVLQNDRDCAA